MRIFIQMMLFLLLVSMSDFARAGGENTNPFGARAAGMGNASVMLSDIWSVNSNQAGLAGLKGMTCGFHYENRFFVPELSLGAGAFALPTKSGTFALSFSNFGYSNYYESKAGLAYAKNLWDFLSVGIQFDYLNTYLSEYYGNKGTVAVEMGIRYVYKDNMYIGAHVFNPTRSKIAAYNDERVPTIMKIGIGYNFSRKVLIVSEVEKDLVAKPAFKAGVEYNFMENFFLRTGVISNPGNISFGVGYEYKGLKADIAFITHQTLGLSPHVSLLWIFNTEDKKESLL